MKGYQILKSLSVALRFFVKLFQTLSPWYLLKDYLLQMQTNRWYSRKIQTEKNQVKADCIDITGFISEYCNRFKKNFNNQGAYFQTTH